MKRFYALALGLILSQSIIAQLEFIDPPQWVKDKVHKNYSGQTTGTRFITKCVMYRGLFAIASTDNVPNEAYDEAVAIVEQMIGHDPYGIFQQLYDIKHVMLLFNGDDSGPNERVSDFGCYASTGADNYGYGGNPNSSGGTVSSLNIENFGWRDGNGVYREDIFIHEFSHGIHLCGLAHTDIDSRILAQFNSQGRSLWAGTYAATDHKEYWAEMSQSYFDANYWSAADPSHNGWDTKEELLTNDPNGYALCDEVYGRPNSLEPISGDSFKVFPTLANERIFVRGVPGKFEVIDLLGQTVMESFEPGVVEVADLHAGIYFVRSIESGKSIRFVKR